MLFEKLSNQLNDLHISYDNILLQGDFNVTPEDLKLQDFCDTHDFHNLIKERTWFKGINPICIELILINKKQLFMKSRTFIKGISDPPALTISAMKLIMLKTTLKLNFIEITKSLKMIYFKLI